jgi:hypothetical protein
MTEDNVHIHAVVPKQKRAKCSDGSICQAGSLLHLREPESSGRPLGQLSPRRTSIDSRSGFMITPRSPVLLQRVPHEFRAIYLAQPPGSRQARDCAPVSNRTPIAPACLSRVGVRLLLANGLPSMCGSLP